MQVEIVQEPVVRSKVIYATGRDVNTNRLMSLVVFQRLGATFNMISNAQEGDKFEVLAHIEHSPSYGDQYIVDAATPAVTDAQSRQSRMKELDDWRKTNWACLTRDARDANTMNNTVLAQTMETYRAEYLALKAQVEAQEAAS